MTTDTEQAPSTTPLLERAGVLDATEVPFISAAIPIRVEDDDDPVTVGDRHARMTYDWIKAELADLRNRRDEMNVEINRLVEAEAIWAPIVHRLDSGIRRRGGVTSPPDQGLPLD